MKPKDAASEIISLLEEGKRRGGPVPSPELSAFLEELRSTPGLKKPATSRRKNSSGEGATRVAPRPKLDEAAMSKTIDELAEKLRAAFGSDTSFEALIREPTVQSLSKPNVITLFNRVFRTTREFPKSLTKPDLFNAIRRERINRVRSGY